MKKHPPKNIKKSRKAEVNYLPPYPQRESKRALECERMEALHKVKNRNNCQISEYIETTESCQSCSMSQIFSRKLFAVNCFIRVDFQH